MRQGIVPMGGYTDEAGHCTNVPMGGYTDEAGYCMYQWEDTQMKHFALYQWEDIFR